MKKTLRETLDDSSRARSFCGGLEPPVYPLDRDCVAFMGPPRQPTPLVAKMPW